MTARALSPAKPTRALRVPRSWRLAAVLFLAATGLGGLVPQSTDAATAERAGWWSRFNDDILDVGGISTGVGSGVQPPNEAGGATGATVPEGGILVQGAADGPIAIAAVRFVLSDAETSPVLSLTTADGSSPPDSVVIGACFTGSNWSAESGGAWDDKPIIGCSKGSVNGFTDDDGATWSFPVSPLLVGKVLDIVLIPGTNPDAPSGANGAVFQLAFEAPSQTSLTTQAAPPEPFEPPAAFPAPPSPPVTSQVPAVVRGTPSLPQETFSAPSTGFAPAGNELVDGVTPDSPLGQSGLATPTSNITNITTTGGSPRRVGALLTFIAIGIGIGVARQETPALRSLTRVGRKPEDALPTAGENSALELADASDAAKPGGLGRFSKVRLGPPMPIS